MLKVRIPWNTGKQFCAEEQCFECEPIIGSVTSLRPGLLVGRLVCLVLERTGNYTSMLLSEHLFSCFPAISQKVEFGLISHTLF